MSIELSTANDLLSCYAELRQKQSNVVRELTQGRAEIYQWQHYPENDVKDLATHSQYFFHCHPGHDVERFCEHGHFHLFLRQAGIPPVYVPSDRCAESTTSPNDLCHLLCISMNEFGYPQGFFTLNQWVTKGLWYAAPAMCAMLDVFKITLSAPSILLHQWMNAIIQLYKPYLKEMMIKRDAVVAQWQKDHPAVNVLSDESLEVTSFLPITTCS